MKEKKNKGRNIIKKEEVNINNKKQEPVLHALDPYSNTPEEDWPKHKLLKQFSEKLLFIKDLLNVGTW